jgi:Domain of unknown function (DUF4328)
VPIVSCPLCRQPLAGSERPGDRRLYCPTCREWFSVTAERPKSSFTVGRNDAPPRREPAREDADAFDGDAALDDDERRRRIRRRRRLIETDGESVSPPLGRGIGISACILLAVAGFAELAMVGNYIRESINDAGPRTIEMTLALQNMLEYLLFLVTGTVFLGWLRLAHRNVAFLRGPELSRSSGWTVGSFFVPLLCLVSPYLAIQEIWKASTPLPSTTSNPAADEEFEPSRPGPSMLIRTWWIVWVAANCLAPLLRTFALAFERDLWRLIPLLAVPHLLFAIAAPLAILVVRAMTLRQEERWRSLLTETIVVDDQ